MEITYDVWGADSPLDINVAEHSRTSLPTGTGPQDADVPILPERRRVLLQSIIELHTDIEQRRQLGEQKVQSIDEVLGQARSVLRRFAHHQHSPEFQRMYLLLQHEVLAAEREAAQEPIETWRDVSRIKSELRELLLEYLALPR